MEKNRNAANPSFFGNSFPHCLSSALKNPSFDSNSFNVGEIVGANSYQKRHQIFFFSLFLIRFVHRELSVLSIILAKISKTFNPKKRYTKRFFVIPKKIRSMYKLYDGIICTVVHGVLKMSN